MPSEFEEQVDEAVRKVLSDYVAALSRVGLRAEYAGLAVQDEVDDARSSAVEVWIHRGRELVDSVEVWAERPGLGARSAQDVERQLRADMSELLSLHQLALATGGRRTLPAAPAAPLPVPAEGARAPESPYVQRLHALYFKIMPLVALVLSFAMIASGEDILQSLLLGPVGAFIFGLPTAMVASLAHTKIAEATRRDSLPFSAAVGTGLGLAAGAFTPWFFPSFHPEFIAFGGVIGAVYGSVVSRWHRLPAVRVAALEGGGMRQLAGATSEPPADAAPSPGDDPAPSAS